MPTKSIDHPRSTPTPVEFAGKWVVWNANHSQVLAHSDGIEDLWRIVAERGIQNPIFEKVPRADVRFVGTR